MTFAYDDVPYDTEAHADAHPRAMGTIAKLHGLAPAMPSSCRFLEIGCGDGGHMTPAAAYLPGARFVGFDLATQAIEAGKRFAAPNVSLLHRDVRDVRASGIGEHDYVVAHGVYSWVPEDVRADVLAVIRAALAPQGVAFLSVNALPGWSLTEALRHLALHRAASLADPAAKVRAALETIEEIAAVEDEPGFPGILAAHARVYLDHVARATPKDAPFSRYVFHDLLAECNDPFSADDLRARLAAAGLRVFSSAPMGDPTGLPFAQVLACRDDAAPSDAPSVDALLDAWLWADLRADGGALRTTTGALVRPGGEDGLARAARHAPGFVKIRELGDDDARRRVIGEDVLRAMKDGTFTVVLEPPPTASSKPAYPRVAPLVRARAEGAFMAGAQGAVLVNALHRSFRVPREELAVIRLLDGTHAPAAVEASLVERLFRYAFLVSP